MKALIQRIYATPASARILAWGKLITLTGAAQLVVQATAFVSGLLIIRTLSLQEYALYTLANTMLGTMVVLADGGIATGVMAEGGKVWQDKEKLGKVLATGFDLKRKFSLVSLLIATPVLFYLLLHHGHNWFMALLVVVSLIPAFYTALSGQLLEIAPRLWQDVMPLQRIQMSANIGRLALLALSLFAFPWAFVALLAYGLPQVWANLAMRKTAKKYASPRQQADPQVRKEVLSVVYRRFPEALYYCVSGQITIWLISIFGTTTELAQLGGLGRITMLTNLLFVLFCTLIIPRFARLPAVRALLLKRFLQMLLVLLMLAVLLTATFWLFSTEILMVLGRQYMQLEYELLLSTVAACLSLLAGTAFYLCTSRGWIINPLYSIPVSIGAIAIGAYTLNVASLEGILMLNILVAGIQALLNITYGLIRLSGMSATE